MTELMDAPPELTDTTEMEAVVEAILFVSSEPVTRARLLQVFDDDESVLAAAERAIDRVVERWRERPASGVMIDEVAGGLRLVTRPELHADLRRFFEVSGSNRLSMPALETLAIVAYRQPVTAPEIQELRGVNSSGVLKTLLERRLVRIAGRKEVVGKPFLYATTREFLMHFGLRHLNELPPLEQFEEMLAADPEAGAGPDDEEQVLQAAAALDDAEDDAAEAAESEEIEQERADAEAAQEAAEADDPELAETDVPETDSTEALDETVDESSSSDGDADLETEDDPENDPDDDPRGGADDDPPRPTPPQESIP